MFPKKAPGSIRNMRLGLESRTVPYFRKIVHAAKSVLFIGSPAKGGAFGFLGLAFLFLAISCQRAEPPVLKIGINMWPGYETFYLAEKLGYYKGIDVRVIQFPSASEVVRNYRNGAIDFAALTADETFYLAESGLSPKIVLVLDESSGADVLLSKPHIRYLAELKGKRIGAENGALGAYMLTRALDKGGLRPEDIILVPSEVNQHESIYAQGKVDAVVTFEPVKTKLLKADARLLFSSKEIPGEICDVLVVRPSFLKAHPKEVAQLLEIHFRALDYLASNPKKASEIIAPREGVSAEEFLHSLEGLHIPDKEENRPLLGDKNSSFIRGIRELAGVMLSKGLLSKPVNVEEMVESAPIEGGKR